MTERSVTHCVLDTHHQQLLDACRFVLVRPSLAANIGSAVRAMTTMGVRDLVVVAPQDPDFRDDNGALARAGGARARLQEVGSCERLADALADCQLAVAVSAEGREFGPLPEFPAPLCADLLQKLARGDLRKLAFVFGTERTGLSVEQMGQCQRWLTIPADAAYSSLNVAQAVQIVAFSLRQAVLANAGRLASGAEPGFHAVQDEGVRKDPAVAALAAGGQEGDAIGVAASDAVAADHHRAAAAASGTARAELGALEGLLAHAERSLTGLGTLDPARPRKLMARLRHILNRAGLDQDEVDMLRGICRDIERVTGRDHGQRTR